MLEPYEGKLSRTVLRGEGGSNTADPLDYTEEDDDYLDNLADEVDEIMAEDEETEESRLLKNEESDSDANDSGDEE